MKNNKARWIYIFIGMIIMMCLGTVYSWSIFRLPIEREFSISIAESGYPYMFSLAFYALFVLLTGKYIEKYSPRKIIALGGVLVGSGWILSSFASNIYILTLSYGVMIGSGVGIVYGVPMNVIAKWFPDKKGLATGLVLVGFGLSPFITAPIASYLVQSRGVMDAFFIMGIAFLVIIPILSLFIKAPKEESKVEINSTTKDFDAKNMVKTTEFKILYTNFIFGSMIGLMIIGITSNVGVEMINLSEKTVAGFMSLFAIFNGLGRVSFGIITDKLNIKTAMRLSYILIMIAAVLMLFLGEKNSKIYMISFCIFWFNLGGWLAIAPTSTMNLFGTRSYSKNYGVVFTAYGIGAILGVVISGVLKDIFSSYLIIFFFIIAVSMTGYIISGKIIQTHKIFKIVKTIESK